MRRLILIGAVVALIPGTALAHAGGSDSAWSPDLGTAVLLGLFAAGYAIGFFRLRARSRGGVANAGTGLLFAAGVAALAAVLLSPLDGAADGLLTAHMIQHIVLMMVAPSLIVLARPGAMLLWSLPRPFRRLAGRVLHWRLSSSLLTWLQTPQVAAIVFVLAFIVWHLPGIYQLANRNEAVHAAEHLSFLAVGLLFWAAVLAPRRHTDHAQRILGVVSAALGTGMPAALLILAQRPLYGTDAAVTASWGLSPLQDQQLAGLLMWIPMELAFLGVAAWLFATWIGARVPPRPPREPHVARAGPILSAAAAVFLAGVQFAPAAAADASAAAALIDHYGCGNCHLIPGIQGADGNVGPPLIGIGSRAYIAGVLPNTTDNLIHWIQAPQSVVPGNVMPDMGIDKADAAEIAAYLQTLR